MKPVYRALAMVVLTGLVFTAGCGYYQGRMRCSDTTRNGIPCERWRVGGGLHIEYTAPADGTMYVVDLESKRFLLTESVEEGDDFSFDVTTEDEFTELGIDPSAKIALYFVPASVFSPERPEEK